MTDKEQIEEMCRTMAIYLGANKCEAICGKQEYCHLFSFAENLYNAGYRKADEVRKKTAREILQTLYNYPHEYHERRIKELAKKYGVEVEE